MTKEKYNLKDCLEMCQSSTFREYLLWKNQNINMFSLINRLQKANNLNHIHGILKSIL